MLMSLQHTASVGNCTVYIANVQRLCIAVLSLFNMFQPIQNEGSCPYSPVVLGSLFHIFGILPKLPWIPWKTDGFMVQPIWNKLSHWRSWFIMIHHDSSSHFCFCKTHKTPLKPPSAEVCLPRPDPGFISRWPGIWRCLWGMSNCLKNGRHLLILGWDYPLVMSK